jgi:hypothetical protein
MVVLLVGKHGWRVDNCTLHWGLWHVSNSTSPHVIKQSVDSEYDTVMAKIQPQLTKKEVR